MTENFNLRPGSSLIYDILNVVHGPPVQPLGTTENSLKMDFFFHGKEDKEKEMNVKPVKERIKDLEEKIRQSGDEKEKRKSEVNAGKIGIIHMLRQRRKEDKKEQQENLISILKQPKHDQNERIRKPTRKRRSKSADGKPRKSYSMFNPLYTKIISKEEMKEREKWAERLRMDAILEEEYYKLPYEEINREIVLGRYSQSETRLNFRRKANKRVSFSPDIQQSEGKLNDYNWKEDSGYHEDISVDLSDEKSSRNVLLDETKGYHIAPRDSGVYNESVDLSQDSESLSDESIEDDTFVDSCLDVSYDKHICSTPDLKLSELESLYDIVKEQERRLSDEGISISGSKSDILEEENTGDYIKELVLGSSTNNQSPRKDGQKPKPRNRNIHEEENKSNSKQTLQDTEKEIKFDTNNFTSQTVSPVKFEIEKENYRNDHILETSFSSNDEIKINSTIAVTNFSSERYCGKDLETIKQIDNQNVNYNFGNKNQNQYDINNIGCQSVKNVKMTTNPVENCDYLNNKLSIENNPKEADSKVRNKGHNTLHNLNKDCEIANLNNKKFLEDEFCNKNNFKSNEENINKESKHYDSHSNSSEENVSSEDLTDEELKFSTEDSTEGEDHNFTKDSLNRKVKERHVSFAEEDTIRNICNTSSDSEDTSEVESSYSESSPDEDGAVIEYDLDSGMTSVSQRQENVLPFSVNNNYISESNSIKRSNLDMVDEEDANVLYIGKPLLATTKIIKSEELQKINPDVTDQIKNIAKYVTESNDRENTDFQSNLESISSIYDELRKDDTPCTFDDFNVYKDNSQSKENPCNDQDNNNISKEILELPKNCRDSDANDISFITNKPNNVSDSSLLMPGRNDQSDKLKSFKDRRKEMYAQRHNFLYGPSISQKSSNEHPVDDHALPKADSSKVVGKFDEPESISSNLVHKNPDQEISNFSTPKSLQNTSISNDISNNKTCEKNISVKNMDRNFSTFSNGTLGNNKGENANSHTDSQSSETNNIISEASRDKRPCANDKMLNGDKVDMTSNDHSKKMENKDSSINALPLFELRMGKECKEHCSEENAKNVNVSETMSMIAPSHEEYSRESDANEKPKKLKTTNNIAKQKITDVIKISSVISHNDINVFENSNTANNSPELRYQEKNITEKHSRVDSSAIYEETIPNNELIDNAPQKIQTTNVTQKPRALPRNSLKNKKKASDSDQKIKNSNEELLYNWIHNKNKIREAFVKAGLNTDVIDDLEREELMSSSEFRENLVNILMSKGFDITDYTIWLQTRTVNTKPRVSVTRRVLPLSALRKEKNNNENNQGYSCLISSSKENTQKSTIALTISPAEADPDTKVDKIENTASPTPSWAESSSSGCFSCSPTPYGLKAVPVPTHL